MIGDSRENENENEFVARAKKRNARSLKGKTQISK